MQSHEKCVLYQIGYRWSGESCSFSANDGTSPAHFPLFFFFIELFIKAVTENSFPTPACGGNDLRRFFESDAFVTFWKTVSDVKGIFCVKFSILQEMVAFD